MYFDVTKCYVFKKNSIFSLCSHFPDRSNRKMRRASDECFFAIEKIEKLNLIGNVPHKSVLSCATVVSFPVNREGKTKNLSAKILPPPIAYLSSFLFASCDWPGNNCNAG